MLIALVVHSGQSLIALVYYVITYALATLGAFGVLVALEGEKVDRIADFRGLGKRAPDLSFCLLIFLLSLAGIPPLAGFFGKFYVFVSALDVPDHFGLLWLVLLALAMSVVSFYYYLKVLKQAYVSEPVTGSRGHPRAVDHPPGVVGDGRAGLASRLFAGSAAQQDCGGGCHCVPVTPVIQLC